MASRYESSSSRLLLDADSSVPVAILSSHTAFDANMVIILAAMLCALICALGLNSIVRCILHCTRRNVETPGQAAARLTATGLKKSEVQQIPVVMYGAVEEGLRVVATECAICLGEFVDGEKVRVLPACNHGFHVVCVDTWLMSHSSCPTCRQSLLEHKRTQDDSDSGTRQGNVPNRQSDVPDA